jgi:hypothetical protein
VDSNKLNTHKMLSSNKSVLIEVINRTRREEVCILGKGIRTFISLSNIEESPLTLFKEGIETLYLSLYHLLEISQ